MSTLASRGGVGPETGLKGPGVGSWPRFRAPTVSSSALVLVIGSAWGSRSGWCGGVHRTGAGLGVRRHSSHISVNAVQAGERMRVVDARLIDQRGEDPGHLVVGSAAPPRRLRPASAPARRPGSGPGSPWPAAGTTAGQGACCGCGGWDRTAPGTRRVYVQLTMVVVDARRSHAVASAAASCGRAISSMFALPPQRRQLHRSRRLHSWSRTAVPERGRLG